MNSRKAAVGKVSFSGRENIIAVVPATGDDRGMMAYTHLASVCSQADLRFVPGLVCPLTSRCRLHVALRHPPHCESLARTLAFACFATRLCGSAEQNLRWQIPPVLPAQRAGDDDGLKREVVYPGGYPAITPLAFDDEPLAFLDSECHCRTNIGEHMANVHARESCALPGLWMIGERCLSTGSGSKGPGSLRCNELPVTARTTARE